MSSTSYLPRLTLLIILVLTLNAGELTAQSLPVSIPLEVPGVQYLESVPPPHQVMGHRIGERHTRTDQVEAYFKAVEESSDRVIVRRHGSTYENRPLIHAIVASPENHRRLNEIRAANLRLSDEPMNLNDEALAEMPTIVHMGYSVHGNEASGVEAAVLLLYHLAAGIGPPVDAVLQNCITIIDPMLNPDGRSRFVNWVNGNRGRTPTTDPNDREHVEPWPGGRTNHYLFDLNRDWLPAQLQESQARLELFHHWRPQVVTDFHEMGSESTFFFQPGVPSRNNPNTPESTHELTREIARFHAKYLDRIGSLYYSEENFDDFYFGKGSTYPDINGAIGILFEQASSRSLARETSSGVLNYDFTIRNQFMASLSTLDAASTMRKKLLQHQRDFYRESIELGVSAPTQAYLLSQNGQRDRLHHFLEVLLRHRILVYRLEKDWELPGQTFSSFESYIVPARQPQSRLLKVLMEKVTDFSDSVFYDVSTWTLPLAFAVDLTEVEEDPSPYLGSQLLEAPPLKGRLLGGRAQYAYLMPWTSFWAPKALYSLQKEGLKIRLLTEPISLDRGTDTLKLQRGTLIIPVTQEDLSTDEVHSLVRQAVEQSGASVHTVSSGLTSFGPDFGGPSTRSLRLPEVVLISGPGTRSYQVGETWFLLNERMGIPVSLLDCSSLQRTSLNRYNTMVFVGGSYGFLDDTVVGRIRDWIREGGVLICLHEAARWAVEKGLIDEKLKQINQLAKDLPYSQIRQQRRSQSIPGSIFEAEMDLSHPLAFGSKKRLPFFRDHQNIFELSRVAGSTVARYTDSPLLSGYIPDEKLPELAGSAALIARTMGRGRVILFADNPNFRAFWYGTSSLFLNAIFFGNVF